MICNACSGSSFKQFAVRDDGMEIKQCTQCGLGVVAHLPESTEAYYDDNYYVDGGSSGYVDYSFMAEHGLGWTAALVKLLCNGGRILDIGCADGYLLDKFKPDFEKFGIEVNAKAAAQARDKGITILGNDLLDPRLVQDQGSSFDVVTSIAVFEHLLGFREGFKAAIDLLKTDGFMVFEVPVMSATQSNAAWMQSSFEHIYYPTEKSIRYIVENTLGCQLVGAELPIKDYASTYVGIVTRDLRQFERIKAVFDRVMRADFASDRADEVRASTHLHLLHAGQATEASVLSLNELATGEMTPQLLARIAQLWSFDLRRLGVRVLQGVELNAAKIEIARLKADLEVVQNDARLNAARATEALNFEIRRAARELGDAVALRKSCRSPKLGRPTWRLVRCMHRLVSTPSRGAPPGA
ncbi:class I SAM-dependent methyltransferase [Variovorax ureilyticus]|uniref:class I SAM-dependent methyltransferase n=1 Tax=Variovorax ureilyticus TaxID=1836198 RepID=UPI003D66457F